MLLSHNFDLYNNELPPLNKKQFAQIFIDGLKEQNNLNCNLIENPHWIVEIIFPTNEFSAAEVGEKCGYILKEAREQQRSENNKMPDILILGGKKTTPALGNSPTSLQIGEWGVDVVETAAADIFLSSIRWETTISSKPIDSIFKIELLGK